MHVVVRKGDWAVQESVVGTGPEAIKAAVATILKQHPSIVGPNSTVFVHADDGTDPSTFPLSAFTEGGLTATDPQSEVVEEPTPLHQPETGEAGA